MTDRNNSERIGLVPTQEPTVTVPQATLSYVSPTEFVDLPSEGKFYPVGHILRDKPTLEIKYMTAKEEDILTSKTLLRKGLAIDRMLESLLADPKVKVDDLLLGDKNAVILAARKTGYGSKYDTSVTCPKCEKKTQFSFNLDEIKNKDLIPDNTECQLTENGTILVTLPKTKASLEVKLITGKEEKIIIATKEMKEKEKKQETASTTQLKVLIKSVNGDSARSAIDIFVETMPAFDARYLRELFKKITPDVDMTQQFTCSNCDYEEAIEVPLTADFFWPNR